MNLPLQTAPQSSAWAPTKMMYWYDAIIDDMFAHPEAMDAKEIAVRLNRHAVTIGLVIRSDLFKARYEQRKAAFNTALHERITGKMAQVAEKALDLTLEVMKTKQTAVPLPQLTAIANSALEKLGYGPAGSPSVVIQNNVGSAAQVTAPVSAEVLAAARESLRQVEARTITVEANAAQPQYVDPSNGGAREAKPAAPSSAAGTEGEV